MHHWDRILPRWTHLWFEECGVDAIFTNENFICAAKRFPFAGASVRNLIISHQIKCTRGCCAIASWRLFRPRAECTSASIERECHCATVCCCAWGEVLWKRWERDDAISLTLNTPSPPPRFLFITCLWGEGQRNACLSASSVLAPRAHRDSREEMGLSFPHVSRWKAQVSEARAAQKLQEREFSQERTQKLHIFLFSTNI